MMMLRMIIIIQESVISNTNAQTLVHDGIK